MPGTGEGDTMKDTTLILVGLILFSAISLASLVMASNMIAERGDKISGFSVRLAGDASYSGDGPDFAERRAMVMEELHDAILDAVESGDYSCCIDPPCTMCYMGSWEWDDGICRCDQMMIEGNWDKVCPQCKRGFEQGLCKSVNRTSCASEIPDAEEAFAAGEAA
jgi:hypothetical protein